MALVSPGVEVTVIDESQYVPADQGTVASIIVATAQDKTVPCELWIELITGIKNYHRLRKKIVLLTRHCSFVV